ncbi:MAG: glycosyltransferase [Bacteroidetes bacterium]|nr:glycosyltransferase [Bacteroidota bacterium]
MKVFVVLSRVPYPLDKGDKLRAFNFIRYLSEYHDIYLCCLNEHPLHPNALSKIKPFCKEIYIINISKISIFFNLFKTLFTGKPFQIGYFYNNKAKKRIDSIIKTISPDHIFCQLCRMAEYVKDINIPKTIDYQDVFSYGIKRRILTDEFYLQVLLHSEYKRLIKYEHDVFDCFEHKIIISETDRNLIPHNQNNEIHVIPNGVDTSYYFPIETEKKYDIIFTGNMAYPPNIDACQYLVKDILPLVMKKYPNIKVLLAGASPHFLVRKLKSNNVEVTGWVNDMRNCYAKSTIFIAPMRIGTGLQNKLLEAMAMRLPCITTTLANDALKAMDSRDVLIGNTQEELAQHICYLLENKYKSNEIALNGYYLVQSNFSWAKNIEELNQIITNTK